jgi:AcrR family transcriptional regulator
MTVVEGAELEGDDLEPAGADSGPDSGPDRGADKSVPRRSALTQTRSRNTRRKLIRTALELWNERGFESSFEEITAEEIARAAGVSKGTFYFHFARKDDLLLEMPWATAEIMISEAQVAMERGDRTSDILEQLMNSLAVRVSRAPRGALLRVIAYWSNNLHTEPVAVTQAHGFGEAFEAVGNYAISHGDLPRDVEVSEFAGLLQVATMDALVGWSATSQSTADLRDRLCRRADVILAGVAVSYRR